MFRYRDKQIAGKIIGRLREMQLHNIRIMHVCGTHQDTLVRYGLEPMLKEVSVEIRQGPGCPVCVTTPREIEEAIQLARSNITLTTFGDMLKVPGIKQSLEDVRAEGCDVRIVYSVSDSIKIARDTDNEVVFMSVGFETTTPLTASVILDGPPDNFSILSCHRLIPPAMKALLEMGELQIDGFIDPGHVSTIIGTRPYEFISKEYDVPQVIAGFEPLDLLMGIYLLARQIKSGIARVENEYTRVVREEGNLIALEKMDQVFEPCDVPWRGFSMIPGSGLRLRDEYEMYDARRRFEDELKPLDDMDLKEHPGCRCGEVLRGIIYPNECNLFGKTCTPATPVGPCMVSREGNCNIIHRYGKTV